MNGDKISMKRVAVFVPEDRAHEVIALAKALREEVRSLDDTGYRPGGDAIAISRIANQHFGGFREMFVHHGWAERGSDMMRKVQSRVKETYGSIKDFEEFFSDKNLG